MPTDADRATFPDGLFLGILVKPYETRIALVDSKYTERRYFNIISVTGMDERDIEEHGTELRSRIWNLVKEAYEDRERGFINTTARTHIDRACVIFSDCDKRDAIVWRIKVWEYLKENLVGPNKFIASVSEVQEETEVYLLTHRFCLESPELRARRDEMEQELQREDEERSTEWQAARRESLDRRMEGVPVAANERERRKNQKERQLKREERNVAEKNRRDILSGVEREIHVALFIGFYPACTVIKGRSDKPEIEHIGAVNRNFEPIGGSYWIARQAVSRMYEETFDVDDGNIEPEQRTTTKIEELYLSHFRINHIHDITRFVPESQKYEMARFAKAMYNHGENDDVIKEIFYGAGQALGQLINSAMQEIPAPYVDRFDPRKGRARKPLRVLLSGGGSYALGYLYDGLKSELVKNVHVSKLELYKTSEESEICAAVQAAAEVGVKLQQEPPKFELSVNVPNILEEEPSFRYIPA